MSEAPVDVDPLNPPAEQGRFRKRNLVLILPAMLAMYGVYQGIQQVLLPAQVEAIDEAAKVANLAVLSIVSSVAATIALPLGGAISDRTRSRFGRRAPWLAVAAVLAAALCVGMGFMASIAGLAIVYGALWFVMNWYQGVIYAVVPDRVPERLRGTASSLIGLALPLGVLAAVNVVSRTSQEVGYLLLAVGLLVATVLFVLGAPDSSSVDAPHSAARPSGPFLKRVLAQFASFADRDFTLVFLSRIVFFFGIFAVQTYTFYIVTDHIGMDNVPLGSAGEAVGLIASVSTVAQVVAVAIVGWVADKLDRRKLVVGLSSLGMAVGFAIPLLLPTWTGMLIYAVVLGASSGVYFAVDLALMSLVLPSSGDEGRDLGLLAIATSVPSAFAPAVAAWLILVTTSYSSLFVFGIAASVVGGVLVFLVRKIR
ncbi:MAG: MFS transporter [Microbacterium sp.]